MERVDHESLLQFFPLGHSPTVLGCAHRHVLSWYYPQSQHQDHPHGGIHKDTLTTMSVLKSSTAPLATEACPFQPVSMSPDR